MSWQTKKNRLSLKKTLDYLKAKSERNPDIRLFFFDEARFGLQTSLSKIWALAGNPLQIKVKQAYQNFYIYSSVEPKTGENFSLFLPWVNTEMMNLYLEQMSLAYKNEETVIIMDQAGWHKSKDIVVPNNIEIIYLPPYSPELNPVERLWKHMKTNYIHNRIFDSLKQMIDKMVDAFEKLNNDKVASLCHCNYLDL